MIKTYNSKHVQLFPILLEMVEWSHNWITYSSTCHNYKYL